MSNEKNTLGKKSYYDLQAQAIHIFEDVGDLDNLKGMLQLACDVLKVDDLADLPADSRFGLLQLLDRVKNELGEAVTELDEIVTSVETDLRAKIRELETGNDDETDEQVMETIRKHHKAASQEVDELVKSRQEEKEKPQNQGEAN